MSVARNNDRYSHIRSLGRGAYGDVYLALDKEKNQHVAIKYIKVDKLAEHVQREILNHQRVSAHPHVISFKSVFVDSDSIGIVMEYAAGGELFTRVQQHRGLNEADSRFYFQQLVIGVDFCHARNISNRDMKLENLLLTSNSSRALLKICDFGFAKSSVMDSAPNSTVGTPEYMAPEVFWGVRYDGHKADVWSMGVILYTMLVGKYPFRVNRQITDPTFMQRLFQKLSNREYVLPERLSPPCRDLLNGMLDPKPETRFSVKQILEHPWVRQDMPPLALTLNMQLLKQPIVTEQSEDDINASLAEAKRLKHANVAHRTGSEGFEDAMREVMMDEAATAAH